MICPSNVSNDNITIHARTLVHKFVPQFILFKHLSQRYKSKSRGKIAVPATTARAPTADSWNQVCIVPSSHKVDKGVNRVCDSLNVCLVSFDEGVEVVDSLQGGLSKSRGIMDLIVLHLLTLSETLVLRLWP
jgi:hypothetical protein